MENEENRGLIHKKPYENKLVTFCQFSFGAFSLFSLALTLGHTKFSWSIFGIGSRRIRKEIGSKYQVGKGKTKPLQQDSLQVSIFLCIFLVRFVMHGIACCSLSIVAWVFLGVIVFLV